MEIKKYTEQNRAAWNEVANFHAKGREKRIDDGKNESFSLDAVITEYIEEREIIEGKRVAQLCCNSGRETIALKRMGALSCTGFDISDEAIEEARSLTVPTGTECTFIRTDVYDIPALYDCTFDVVYISAGALTWLPDLEVFFKIVHGILKDRGEILIYEIHPYIWMLEESPRDNPLLISSSYFKNDPVVSYGGLDYIGHEEYKGRINYTFDHTISHIINSLIMSKFSIKEYNEYSHDISACFHHLKKEEVKIPMSFILYGERY